MMRMHILTVQRCFLALFIFAQVLVLAGSSAPPAADWMGKAFGVSGAVTDTVYNQLDSFSTIFQNLSNSLNKGFPALIALCYLLGIFFILKALYTLKKLGYKTAFMHAGSSMLGPAAMVIIGVILMYTPGFLKIMFMTLYGTDHVTSVTAWVNAPHFKGASSGGGSHHNWDTVIKPLIGVIQFIGLCSFIRGWLLVMKSTGENAPPGNLSKGLMHVIGGVLAINIWILSGIL